MGVSEWVNPKIWWKRGRVVKRIVNKFSKININNNTNTCPHIKVNGGGIADSGSTLHWYLRDTPIDNNCPYAELYSVQPYGSQIVSTLQADMKVSTLNKEARRGYKFPTLTQNLVSFTLLEDNECTITLDRTRINVTKSG